MQVGTYGVIIEFLCLSPPSRIGWRLGGKRASERWESDYLDWALSDFSGYLAADELVDLFAWVRALIGADRDASLWDVGIEESQFAGTTDASATVGSRPGEQPFTRFRKRMTIDPSGKVIACETIESGRFSEAEAKVNCEQNAVMPFAASTEPGNRVLTDVSAAYFRKR